MSEKEWRGNYISHIRDSKLFSIKWYLENYAEACSNNIDPIEHYVDIGADKFFDPHPQFSTEFYLKTYPDVLTSKVNPFWHYLKTGKAEGRLPNKDAAADYRYSKARAFFAEPTILNKKREYSKRVISAIDILKYSKDSGLVGSRGIIFSFGHDNYKISMGGVQLCIQREERLARDRNLVYLNISPAHHHNKLADSKREDDVFELIVNGTPIGGCRSGELLKFVETSIRNFELRVLIVHSLIGHSPELLAEINSRGNFQSFYYWIHDYFSLCESYTLQRNGLDYCGAPDIISNACRVCRYGDARAVHLKRIQTLFRLAEVHVISPSSVAAALFNTKSALPWSSFNIIPHIDLDLLEVSAGSKKNQTSGVVKIGYLGHPMPHKGWNVFVNLARRMAGSRQYSFHHFGQTQATNELIGFKRVTNTSDEPDAMTKACEAEGLEFVLHWATSQETFSFTTAEAIQSGAYVLTNRSSGNVAAMVSKTRSGKIFDSEAELLDFFISGEAKTLARTVREDKKSKKFISKYSDLTFTLLKE